MCLIIKLFMSNMKFYAKLRKGPGGLYVTIPKVLMEMESLQPNDFAEIEITNIKKGDVNADGANKH